MNREEYTAELKKRLEGLNEAEINDAILYCEEYFNEAENDEAAISELGTPARFAAQLKAEAVIKDSKSDNERNNMKSLVWIIMGICALPIALPLALTVAILLFVFVLLLFVFTMLAVILFAVCIYVAIASFVTGFLNIGTPADLLIHLGFSFICIGVSILSFSLGYLLLKKMLPYFIQRLSDFYHRHKGGIVNANV